MANVAKIIGIDISKSKFDVCISSSTSAYRHEVYSYDLPSMCRFVSQLDSRCHCVMEATGVYHLPLAFYLHDRGIRVSVVNPLSVKNFSRATMSRTKTDKSDARLLVEYARRMDSPAWTPPAKHYIRIQQLYRYMEHLQRELTCIHNQMEAVSFSPVRDTVLLSMMRRLCRSVQRQMDRIQERIETLLAEADAMAVERIVSIPGIGRKTAIALLTATKGLDGFSSYRKLSSYLGLAPRTYLSGSSVKGKAHICKMGMGWIRKLLYLCAVSACRCNPVCRPFYLRLRQNGKPPKSALIAVANKILKIICAINYKKQLFNPDFI